MNAQLHAEFERYLDSLLTGKSLPDRLTELTRVRTSWEREGWVPVNGKIVALGPQHRELSYAVPISASVPAAHQGMSRGRLLFGCGLIGVFIVLMARLVIGGGQSSIAGPSVPSIPVTATADGPTAPVSIVLGDRTLIVRSFDPALGWPDVTSANIDGAALWGKTTINMVIGVDATALDSELDGLKPGATIVVQQAQGVRVSYRVIEQISGTKTSINYAAQAHVGLTIVGMAPGTERLIVRALPESVPVSETEVEGIRFKAHTPTWTQQPDAPLTLQMTLDVTIPGAGESVPPAWNLNIQLPGGEMQPVAVTPGSGETRQTASVTILNPETDIIELGLLMPGNVRGTVALAVPPRPTATVGFGSAERTAAGLRVQMTISPDGPVALTAVAFTCRATQASVPLVFDGMTFPTVITERKEVVGQCIFPPEVRGSIEILALEDRAVVVVPATR